MSIATKPQPMCAKEGEALMWGLAQIGDRIERTTDDPTDPLYILLHAGYTRPQISEACEGLWEVAYANDLRGGWTTLEAMILRLCIENTSWIEAYRTNPMTAGSPGFTNEARATLRSLAAKFETFGIEINHIPNE